MSARRLRGARTIFVDLRRTRTLRTRSQRRGRYTGGTSPQLEVDGRYTQTRQPKDGRLSAAATLLALVARTMWTRTRSARSLERSRRGRPEEPHAPGSASRFARPRRDSRYSVASTRTVRSSTDEKATPLRLPAVAAVRNVTSTKSHCVAGDW